MTTAVLQMLLVITLALLPCLVSAFEPLDVQTVRYTAVRHKRLINHVFNTTDGADPQQCLADCWAQNDKCRSFNFLIETTVCELNNNTHEDMPADYIDSEFCVYFQNPLFGQEVPNMERNNFTTRPPDPCSSDPCENGGTCIPHKDLGLRCINCSTGFTGKFCELRVDPCFPNPCRAGTCAHVNDFTDYECTCHDSFFGGKRCDKFVDEHKYDMRFTPDEPVSSAHMSSSAVLSEMTLCFTFGTSDALSYLFSYVPDDPAQPERIAVWYNDTKIHVSLAQGHEEIFDNFQGKPIQLCIVLNASAREFNVYMAGAIRNEPKPYTKDSFQLHPGTLYLGYYKDPVKGAIQSNGWISQLNMWDHVKSASEIQMTEELCLSGVSKEGLLWDWNNTEWNSFLLFTPWSPVNPCPGIAEVPTDFRQIRFPHDGSAPQHLKTAVITLPEITHYTISGWVKIGRTSTNDVVFVGLFWQANSFTSLKSFSIMLVQPGLMRITKYIDLQFDVSIGNMRDNKWHHVVLTWSVKDQTYLYTIITDGIFRSHYTDTAAPSSHLRIESASYKLCVGESAPETFTRHTSFSNINMWSRVLPNAYILAMATRGGYDIGDTFAWKDMTAVGTDVMKSMNDYVPDDQRISSEAVKFTNAIEKISVNVPGPPAHATELAICFWLKLNTFDDTVLVTHELTQTTDLAIKLQVKRLRVEFDNGAQRITFSGLETKLLGQWIHICVSIASENDRTSGVGSVGLTDTEKSIVGLYPDEHYGPWIVTTGQNDGGYIAHLNIWPYKLTVNLMLDMARGYVPGVMVGSLLAWSQVLEAASDQGISVAEANEIALPNLIAQAKRDAYCNGLDKEFARTACNSLLPFGWYCVNTADTFDKWLMMISGSYFSQPQPHIATIN